MGVSYTNISRPGAKLQAGNNTQIGTLPAATNPLELHIEEYRGVVQGTVERKSLIRQFVDVRPVKGTSTITGFQIGESTLQKVTPGTSPDGTVNQVGKNKLTIDTMVLARAITPLLDDFQSAFAAREKVGLEHGKKVAKFFDQAFFIQAIKAAQMSNAGLPSGWNGGTSMDMTAVGDELDAQKLEFRLLDLMAAMADKDVDAAEDGCIAVLKPAAYFTLLKNNRLVDMDYVTSQGTSLKAKSLTVGNGLPVYFSNNLPTSNVAGHFLSNAGNANAYDGDFSKVIASIFNPNALLAGETIPLTSDVYYEKKDLAWFIDAYLSFGVAPDNPQYAAVLKSK
tara:strand:- start:260 stop:1273 length:1014 start_codon:yes stop_codon:yes gene_type:complete